MGWSSKFDLGSRSSLRTATSGGGPIWSLAASKDGATLYASCDDGTIRILSLEGGMGSLLSKKWWQKCQDATESSKILEITGEPLRINGLEPTNHRQKLKKDERGTSFEANHLHDDRDHGGY